jgi:methylglutaconyl-CoA hydratase
MVNRVVAPDQLDREVDALVDAVLENGPCALKAAKRLLSEVARLDLDGAAEYTAGMIADLRSSPEGREGMKAFFEKRPPAWVADLEGRSTE